MLTDSAPQKYRILYVEDHEDTIEIVSLVLSEQGYAVTPARTFHTALEWARQYKFDLYLLDSWLSDGFGLELCKEIRMFDPTTPILFYSAAAYQIDRETALMCGAQGYLVKPVMYSVLCDLIARLLQNEGASTGPAT